MHYRTQTANVLNDADRYQRILDWQLFVMEQEARLYGYNPDTTWLPGEPLYPDPRTIYRGCSCDECDNDEMPHGYEGNCVRPMFQILDDGIEYELLTARCKDCEVSWRGKETVCWSCGKEIKPILPPVWEAKSFERPIGRITQIHEDQLGLYATFDIEMTSRVFNFMRDDSWISLFVENTHRMTQAFLGMGRAFNRASESFRGLTPQRLILDEWASVEPYFPPTPPANPFKREDRPIVLVPPVAADLTTPVQGPLMKLPEDVDISAKRIPPLPKIPESRDFSKMDDPYWRISNPPMTEQRRRRT